MWTKNVAKNQSLRTFTAVSVTTAAAAVGVDLGDIGPSQAIILVADAANNGTIYIGDSTVTTANGIPLAASEKLSVPHYNLNSLYAVASANTQTLRLALV